MRAVIEADRAAINSGIPEISGPITIEEAIARALKHNLEYRTRLLEQSLAAGQFEAGKFDMLPELLASAGYTWRDEELTRRSIDAVTGQAQETNPTISVDRERPFADLVLSWSILDFGLSYFSAQQNADRLLKANERRRRAMHNLMQNVRTTFWRAVASQQLRDQVRHSIDEAEAALADSQRIVSSQVRNPAEALRYQRNLLENLRLLENIDRELAAAEIELATLIGVPSGSRIRLVEPEMTAFRPLESDVELMEQVALMRNADLHEQFYDARIAAVETRKAILRMVPNLSIQVGHHYDGDRYVIHQSWNDVSGLIASNLFDIIAGPSRIRAAEMELEVATSKRMAVQMAVVSQLHLARHQYEDALRQYGRAVAIHDVDNRLAQIARSQEQTRMGASLARIAADVTAILSSVRLYHAVAKVHEADSRVQAALGTEPEFESLDDITLEQLEERVGKVLRQSI